MYSLSRDQKTFIEVPRLLPRLLRNCCCYVWVTLNISWNLLNRQSCGISKHSIQLELHFKISTFKGYNCRSCCTNGRALNTWLIRGSNKSVEIGKLFNMIIFRNYWIAINILSVAYYDSESPQYSENENDEPESAWWIKLIFWRFFTFVPSAPPTSCRVLAQLGNHEI